jgi:hypothetical protein
MLAQMLPKTLIKTYARIKLQESDQSGNKQVFKAGPNTVSSVKCDEWNFDQVFDD